MKHVGETIELDNTDWSGDTFENCEMVYAGGELNISGCSMQGCTFVIQGAASGVLGLLAAIYFGEPDREAAQAYLMASLRNAYAAGDNSTGRA